MSGCCKESHTDRVSIYLMGNRNLLTESKINNVSDVLKNVLGFTDIQAKMAMDFSIERGECLIYEGDRNKAVELINKLIKLGIKCRAQSRGHIIK